MTSSYTKHHLNDDSISMFILYIALDQPGCQTNRMGNSPKAWMSIVRSRQDQRLKYCQEHHLLG